MQTPGDVVAQRMWMRLRSPGVMQSIRYGSGQADPAIDLANQHQATVCAEWYAFKIGLDHPASETQKSSSYAVRLGVGSAPKNRLRMLTLCGLQGCADFTQVKCPG